VLLVDDDPDDRLLTSILLDEINPAAYHLTEVATYDAALDALTHGAFDVGLIDYRLGGRDGLDLLGMALARGCSAPLIMLTASVDRSLDESAMQRGAADYLPKGQITAPLLERTIRHAIERARTMLRLRESEERFRFG
jgi:CheY-like chemotaxis protein